jgi:hypothetical protein
VFTTPPYHEQQFIARMSRKLDDEVKERVKHYLGLGFKQRDIVQLQDIHRKISIRSIFEYIYEFR